MPCSNIGQVAQAAMSTLIVSSETKEGLTDSEVRTGYQRHLRVMNPAQA